MNYYFIWVRSNRYHGQTPLTYSSDVKLRAGSVVQIELQKQLVLGVVSGPAPNPKFNTKPVVRVFDLPLLPKPLLSLAGWLIEYYPAPLGIVTQSMLPATLTDKSVELEIPKNLPKADVSSLPKLTKQQKMALDSMKNQDTYILHGTTGSGKTRIYIELALKALSKNSSSIILTPEISLTSQLAGNFKAVFGERVVIVHSNLSPAERSKIWLRCLKSSEPLIVIGPRSALFMPLENIGLIVLDESHEAAYKQDQAPQYQTGRVAAYLSRLTRAHLILGSATPSIADYHLAKEKNKPIIELNQLAQVSLHDKNVSVVDKKDYSKFSKSNIISNELIKAIELALNSGEQALLYLNRRGSARIILCEQCGWQATCPHCDIPLTYHGDKHLLRCHSCTFSDHAPSSCKECGHHEIIYKSAGTKSVVAEAERLFPNARIARFDTDNTASESFERNYQAVKNGEVDIIIGTQMLAKGLDLPKLSTLGVILADSSLYMPDYTAEERTFQLINQVLGRVGRGHLAGRAIIQTYHPDHAIIKDAIDGNYQDFYKREVKARQQFMFPPFCFLMKVSFRRASIKSAEQAALMAKQIISDSRLEVTVEGPAPCFYEKMLGKYQWQLIIKAKKRSDLLNIVKILPKNCSYNIDPLDIL